MEKADCIIVLGAGENEKFFAPRVDKGIELYKQGVAPRIILSGRYWGGFEEDPGHVESILMKDYAMRHGVPEKDLFTEEESKDTIGNLFFTKRDFLEPNSWKKLVIVSVNYHEERVHYIAEKVLGNNYEYSFVGTEPSDTVEENFSIQKEGSSIRKMDVFFKQNPDLNTTDTKTLNEAIYKHHPYYNA